METNNNVLRLPDFGGLAAASSGVALVFSVLYDYSYLTAMGLSLAEVPTTIADHVRSAIIWAPGVLGMVLLAGPMGILQATSTASAKDDTSRFGRFMRVANKLFPFLIGASFIFSALSFTKFFFFGVVGLVTWPFLGPPLLNKLQGETKFSLGVWMACFALPWLALTVCLFGHLQGTKLREGSADGWMLTVKGAEGNTTVHSAGIRRFGESVVFLDPDRRARVLPASELVSASTSKPVARAKRASCEFFSWNCTPLQMEPGDSAPAASVAPTSTAAPASAGATSAAAGNNAKTAVPR